QVLLIRRRHPPWKGWWALPGGFVEIGESCEQAVSREVREETGVRARPVGLVGVYSAPHRDPRAHIISISYRLAMVGGTARGGDDAAVARWFRLDKLPRLSADHRQILRRALAIAADDR
ncbi:MAG: NUDIX hydrolase, partial [Thermoplasmata archaeon]|nr:NUDIX hydrolase [Thermoplasmata archaeon]